MCLNERGTLAASATLTGRGTAEAPARAVLDMLPAVLVLAPVEEGASIAGEEEELELEPAEDWRAATWTSTEESTAQWLHYHRSNPSSLSLSLFRAHSVSSHAAHVAAPASSSAPAWCRVRSRLEAREGVPFRLLLWEKGAAVLLLMIAQARCLWRSERELRHRLSSDQVALDASLPRQLLASPQRTHSYRSSSPVSARPSLSLFRLSARTRRALLSRDMSVRAPQAGAGMTLASHSAPPQDFCNAFWSKRAHAAPGGVSAAAAAAASGASASSTTAAAPQARQHQASDEEIFLACRDGYEALMGRMRGAQKTFDEIRALYKER